MSDVLPDRRQSRRIVVSASVFWATWALIALCDLTSMPGELQVAAFIVAFASVTTAWLAMYQVWEPVTGRSAWSQLFFPGFKVQGHVMFDPLRPAWIKHTLRATGWPVKPLGFTLLALLAVDLLLFIALVLLPA